MRQLLMVVIFVLGFVTVGAPKPDARRLVTVYPRLPLVIVTERGHDPANPDDPGRIPPPGCVVLPCPEGAFCPMVCRP